jgi:hypothetical protein
VSKSVRKRREPFLAEGSGKPSNANRLWNPKDAEAPTVSFYSVIGGLRRAQVSQRSDHGTLYPIYPLLLWFRVCPCRV